MIGKCFDFSDYIYWELTKNQEDERLVSVIILFASNWSLRFLQLSSPISIAKVPSKTIITKCTIWTNDLYQGYIILTYFHNMCIGKVLCKWKICEKLNSATILLEWFSKQMCLSRSFTIYQGVSKNQFWFLWI